MSFFQFKVKDPSYAGAIRRQAQILALDLDFNEVEAGRISIVVNELASNLWKHAKGGEIFLIKNKQSLEILSIDSSPGMANVNECLKDGYSTQGSPGTGLGAIKRLSTHFDLFTSVPKGTVIYASFTPSELKVEKTLFEYGSIMSCYPGEILCGDGWDFSVITDNHHKILVSDGLGHGILANAASESAIKAFAEGKNRTPLEDISAIHVALKSSRGAAIAIADINLENKQLTYAGMGNISSTLSCSTATRKLVTYNGTAGIQLRKVQPMTYQLEDNWLLVMNSDGLSTQWSLTDYPGLQLKHPTLIAAVLYRDFNRGTDDVTVVVVRETV